MTVFRRTDPAFVISMAVAGMALLPLVFLRRASMIQGAGEVRY